MDENLINYSEAINRFKKWKKFLYSDKELQITFLGKNLAENKKAWATRAKKSKKQYAFTKTFRKKLLALQKEMADFYPKYKKSLDSCFYKFVDELQNVHLLDIDLRLEDELPTSPDAGEPKKRGPKPYPRLLSEYIYLLDDLCDSVVSSEKNSVKLELFEYFKPNGEFDLWIRKKLLHNYQGREFKAKKSDDAHVKIKWVEDFFRDQRKLLGIEKLKSSKNKKIIKKK